MGPTLTPEEHKAVSEKVAARKAAVAASLGKTVEEFERDQPGHAHPDADCGDGHGASVAGSSAADDAEADCGVDEEAVLAYIRTRQQTIDRLRAQVRVLESRVKHLETQRDLAEKKCATLRDALAKMREQAKQQAAQQATQQADGQAAHQAAE